MAKRCRDISSFKNPRLWVTDFRLKDRTKHKNKTSWLITSLANIFPLPHLRPSIEQDVFHAFVIVYKVSFVFQCLTTCKDSCPKLGPLTLSYPHLLPLDLRGWRHNKRFWDIEMGLRVFETKHMLGTVCTNLCPQTEGVFLGSHYRSGNSN